MIQHSNECLEQFDPEARLRDIYELAESLYRLGKEEESDIDEETILYASQFDDNYNDFEDQYYEEEEENYFEAKLTKKSNYKNSTKNKKRTVRL